MWQLENRTPFAAGQGWIRNREGAEVWLVVVKATFEVQIDGTTEISKDQLDPVRVPEYYGEPGTSSIRYESDFVLKKTTTDVIVVSNAHASGGRPVHQLDVALSVGPINKKLRIFGDREWDFGEMSAPKPFIKMPLIYERAFGGRDSLSQYPERDWEWRNPVGLGFAVKGEHLHGAQVPNIEYADKLIRSWNDQPNPAGFGVVASHWQPRAAFAGTYGSRWESTRQPLLPDDCDDRYFQCAPLDQQTPSFLNGGEPVSLLNLSSRSPLEFGLPQFDLLLQTRFTDGEKRSHEKPKLHTVILEPDIPRVSLVWHSALECHAKVYQLASTRIEWRPTAANDAEEPVEDLIDLV